MKSILKFLSITLLAVAMFVVTQQPVEAQQFYHNTSGVLCSSEQYVKPYEQPHRLNNWENTHEVPGSVLVSVYLPNSHRWPMPDTVVCFPIDTQHEVARLFALEYYDLHGIDPDVKAIYTVIITGLRRLHPD